MFEEETDAVVNAVIDTETDEKISDVWYRKRLREVLTNPKRFAHWKIVDDQLYYLRPKPVISEIVEDLDRWKMVLPRELRPEALREAHDAPQAGHLGVEKTYQRLAVSYFWPNMFRDVAKYIQTCDKCQRTKVEQGSPAGLMGRRIVEGPWTTIAADIVGPLPRSKSGFQYLLVIQDLFTKWIECRALRAATGPKIREALEDLILSRWGTPKILLTDNGTEFINKVMKSFADNNQITHTTTPTRIRYHPQANPVERVNRTLKTMMIAFIEKDHTEWDTHLADFRFAYNTAFHSSLGTSPAFLNLGRELIPPNSLRHRGQDVTEIETRDTAEWSNRMKELRTIREWVTENLDNANQKQAHQYNLRRRSQKFKVGDLVLKRQHILSSAAQNIAAKLAHKF
jgi:transposase InsO family protein